MKDNLKGVEIDQFKDEDVIKALEYCKDGENRCNKCPYNGRCVTDEADSILLRDALVLIKQLKTQKNLLATQYQAARGKILSLCGRIQNLKNKIETLKKEQWQSEQDADILETILDDKNKDISDLIFKERNNAILEFVEQLKDKVDQDDYGGEFVLVYDIDKTVEEMGVEE